MKRLIVTDEAKADLRDIKRYSRRTWGAEQAKDYRVHIAPKKLAKAYGLS
jgi:plasmid stabilization system protein ParE